MNRQVGRQKAPSSGTEGPSSGLTTRLYRTRCMTCRIQVEVPDERGARLNPYSSVVSSTRAIPSHVAAQQHSGQQWHGQQDTS
jgi:hypothetical protein